MQRALVKASRGSWPLAVGGAVCLRHTVSNHRPAFAIISASVWIAPLPSEVSTRMVCARRISSSATRCQSSSLARRTIGTLLSGCISFKPANPTMNGSQSLGLLRVGVRNTIGTPAFACLRIRAMTVRSEKVEKRRRKSTKGRSRNARRLRCRRTSGPTAPVAQTIAKSALPGRPANITSLSSVAICLG